MKRRTGLEHKGLQEHRSQYQRRKAQALMLVALGMLLLVGIVGLAVDGGSMLGQRRQAQNAADGSSLAGARVMLKYYSQMIRENPVYDIDYNAATEDEIRRSIDNYAASNGMITSTLEAYFVNDQKEIVSVHEGENRGQGACGVDKPAGLCQVGANGRVPWTLGAKGIDVRGTSQTDSFLMRIFGWDKVSAGASASAFMGIGAMADNVGLIPIGLYTSTVDLANIREGQHYQLIDAELDNGSGNWGWVDYNGRGVSATNARAWLLCGFNPTATEEQWTNTWCPSNANAPGWGPTQHFMPISTGNWLPNPDPVFVPAIVYGEGAHGWWLRGSSGQVNANCRDLKNRVDDSGDEGIDVLFPIFDVVIPGGGTDSLYHVRIIIKFKLREGDVSCRPSPIPTATPCPIGQVCPTPQPTNGNRTKWRISGTAMAIYSSGSSGRHGDLRTTKVPVIFLDR